MFVETFHSTIKGIHLALEVKTSFGNSMPAMGSSMEIQFSKTWSSNWQPSMALPKEGERKKPAHGRQQEQSLSDYAQQDLSTVINRRPLDMQWL
jgi:hypothetical protein